MAISSTAGIERRFGGFTASGLAATRPAFVKTIGYDRRRLSSGLSPRRLPTRSLAA